MKTKKFASIVLAMALVLSLGSTAFAASPDTVTTVPGQNGDTINVTGSMADNQSIATVYSVDIAWEDLTFTYTIDGTAQWNPADHSYSGQTSKTWSAGKTVTVTNHSNAGVNVALAFNKADNAAQLGDYNGTFNTTNYALTAGVEGQRENAPSQVSTLSMSGSLVKGTTNATLGTVTVSLTAAN